MASRRRRSPNARKVRYAVVGLGHIAQTAILPAFAHARQSSELVALFSDDPDKLRTLGRRYRLEHAYPYEEFEEGLARAEAEAVFIALPNSLHREYAERAARKSVHVLCEKPLAASVQECLSMIDCAERSGVKLMTAYRLHLDPANLRALELASSGRLGELRIFSSTFTMQVKPDNIRLDRELGGGPLFDIGIYCINAARNLFRAEPERVVAASASSVDPRFAEVPEMVSAVLHFPGDRLASFTCSFGAADSSAYDLIGTRGRLRLDPAYEHSEALVLTAQLGRRREHKRFRKEDQFARELQHFSECVLENREPEPSGLEGMLDVAVITAIREAARTGQSVALALPEETRRPDPERVTSTPPPRRVPTVHVSSPSE